MNVAPDPLVAHPLVAADIMTHDVATVSVDGALSDAVQLMLSRRIGGLPVLGANGDLVGMLTESDLLRRTETGTEAEPRWLQAMFNPSQLADSFARAHGRVVAEVMTHGAATVSETTSLRDIVTLMQAKQLRRVPVLRNGSVVGIVARSDLIRALGQLLQARARTAPIAATDAEIRQGLKAGLANVVWTSKDIHFTVTDGRVHLYGLARDDRDRTAIQVTAENVPGVISVDAHFADPDQCAWVGYGPYD